MDDDDYRLNMLIDALQHVKNKDELRQALTEFANMILEEAKTHASQVAHNYHHHTSR